MKEDFNAFEEKIIYHSVGDKKTLKVGIISDSQIITSSKKEEEWLKIFSFQLQNTLEILKSHKIEALIFAGDLTDGGTEYAYDEILSIYNNVYKSEEEKPIFNYIMGNHDYWLSYMQNGKFSPKFGNPKELQFLFFTKMKEKPFTHKVINGYHFINWGCDNGSLDKPNENVDWVEEQIKKALEDNDKKPIFVITHFAAKDTVYGSNDWGTITIKNILKKYPNIIHFSGHSHFSLIDERSIWQKEFTSIQTQSISYTELDKEFENGPYPCDEYGDIKIAAKNYMGLIMNIDDSKVELQRISFANNKFYEKPWIIELPLDPNNFKYTFEKRFNERHKPKFIFENENDKKIIFENDEKIKDGIAFKFKAAFHENFVHTYKVQLINSKNEIIEKLYCSDFFLLPEDRKKIVRFKLKKNNIPTEEYKVKIFAKESFGKESDNYVEGNLRI